MIIPLEKEQAAHLALNQHDHMPCWCETAWAYEFVLSHIIIEVHVCVTNLTDGGVFLIKD